MSFGDGGGFDGGGGDYGGDYGFDDGGQGYGQDSGAWGDAYSAGTLDGLHQGAGLQDQIAQALAPISGAVADMQADRDAEVLLSQYPQLENGEFAEAVIEQADHMAAQLGVPPQRAHSAQFIGLVMQALGHGGAGQQGGYGQGQFSDDPTAGIREAAQTSPSRSFFNAIRS
jgi:hypothetical protein